MRMGRLVAVWTVAAIAAIGEGQAMTIDLDDPGSEPLHFAVGTVSSEAVTLAGRGAGGATYYNLRAPEAAALAGTTKVQLSAQDGWYVRVDLDGMVFSDTPVLATVPWQ